jgi:hypothetical protein
MERVVAGHHSGDVSIRPCAHVREGAGDLISRARSSRRPGGQWSGDDNARGVSLIGHDPAAGLNHSRQVLAGEIIRRHDVPAGSIHLGHSDPTGEIGARPAIGRSPEMIAAFW